MKTIKVIDWSGQDYSVTIDPGKTIKIDCTYRNSMNPLPTSITLKINDQAIYDSWNLKYIGAIKQITEKTVTIQPSHGRAAKRLKLSDFCDRNWDFNLDEVNKHNEIESQCI